MSRSDLRGGAAPMFLALGCVGFIASAPAHAQAGQEDQPVLGGTTVVSTALDEEGYKAEAASDPVLTEPLLDTPRTITVLQRETLDDMGVTSFSGALRNVPGVTLGVGEGGAGSGDFITLRGFDASNDVTVDGFADRLQYTRSDVFNLERIEVYKGPSGALAGSGGAAGQINLVSKTPGEELFVDATAALGTNDLKRATADVNVPVAGLGAGTAVRLNVMAHDQDVAEREEVFQKRFGFAPSIAFGLGSPTRFTASYFYQEDDNLIDYGIPFDTDGTEFPIDRSNFYGVANVDTEQQTVQLATLRLEHDFSDAVSINNSARWGKVDRYAIWSTPQNRSTVGAPGECAPNPDCTFASAVQAIREGRYDEAIYKSAGPQGIGRDVQNEIIANQLNLVARFGTGSVEHALVVGSEVSWEDYRRDGVNATGLSGRLVNLYDPDPIFSGPITYTRTPGVAVNEASRFSLYAFDTVSFSDRLELNGGVRWERFAAELGSATAPTTEQKDNLWTWQAGVVFKPQENGSIYVSYTDAKQPQALAATSTGAGGTATSPALKNRNFEIGTKWSLLDDALSLTAALFRTERTNEAITDAAGETVFNGKRRVQGLELSATGQISPGWSIYAAYAYLDSKIVRTSATGSGPLQEGESLTQTPDHSFTLWTDYETPWGLELGGGVNYVGERVAINSSPTIESWSFDDYILVNAMAAYDFSENLGLQLNLNNLFNQAYYERPRVTGSYAFAVPGEGRNAMLTLRVRY